MSEPILDSSALLLLKALVLLSVSLLAPALFLRPSATFRHALLASGILGTLFLPVASALVPQWKLAVLELPESLPVTSASAEAPINEDSLEPGEGVVALDPDSVRNRSSRATLTNTASERSWLSRSRLGGWGNWIGLIWVVGALALTVRLFFGDLLLRFRLRDARNLNDSALAEASELALQLGIRKQIRFYLDDKVRMPLVWGILRPTILLPGSSLHWNKEKFRMIVLHELAHIRRRDLLIQKLALLVRAIYWLLPPVWLAIRVLRREAEKACDELVLSRGVQPRTYARELVRAAAQMSGRAIPEGAIGLLGKPHLEDRVRAILKCEHHLRARTLKPRFGWTMTFAGLLMLPMSALVPEFTTVARAGSAPIFESAQARSAEGRDGSLSWTDRGVRQRLRMKGVRISEDYLRIEEISPDGYFRFSEAGGQDRRIEVQPDPSGNLKIRYWVAGQESSAGGADFLREALQRLEDLDHARDQLNDSMDLLTDGLQGSLQDLRKSLQGLEPLRLEKLKVSLKELQLLPEGEEPLGQHLEELKREFSDQRLLQDLRIEGLGEALRGLSLNLNFDLQLGLEELQQAMGDLKIHMGDLKEELGQKREDFSDGLVQAELDVVRSLKGQLSTADWDSLEHRLTTETDRLIRRSGLHLDDGQWMLDANQAQLAGFQERLREILRDVIGSEANSEQLAQELTGIVRSFRMHD